MTKERVDDQWDGTDIEPSYPRYHDPECLINTKGSDNGTTEDDEYYQRFRDGDRFS